METGIVYVIYNKWICNPETNEMPYKIGITGDTVAKRFHGLGLQMPGSFETLFAYQFDDYKKAEKRIHGILNKFRVNGEWFAIQDKELKIVREVCGMMGGTLVTDMIKNAIEAETEEEFSENAHAMNTEVKSSRNKRASKEYPPINPDRPCKVFLFAIYKALREGKKAYDATRSAWPIKEEYRDVHEYEYAVGLQDRISRGAYKITKWNHLPQTDKYEFEGDEVPEFEGFSWQKQIFLDAKTKGSWQHRPHFVVEFDGRGKFRLIQPKRDQWFDCK